MKTAFTADHLAAFRLQRQHLSREHAGTVVDVCRDIAGIQAQVMSAAEMAPSTRRRSTTGRSHRRRRRAVRTHRTRPAERDRI